MHTILMFFRFLFLGDERRLLFLQYPEKILRRQPTGHFQASIFPYHLLKARISLRRDQLFLPKSIVRRRLFLP